MIHKTIAESLTEEGLILRLRSTEHDFVERKSRTDRGGWLRTAVAFANSAPIGWPAFLFVGVDDDGKPQQNADKLEDLAKSVSGMLDQAYPAIYRHIVPIHLADGACLAVVVPGSESRPHFAGKSYIRVGPETNPASEEQYDLLIAERQSKVREILKWKGRNVNQMLHSRHEGRTNTFGGLVKVVDCNQFFVTLEKVSGNPFATHGGLEWYPLTRVDLSGCSDGLVLEVVQGY
jgi:Putative DNA-binding domain